MDASNPFGLFGDSATTMLSLLIFLATRMLAFAVMIGIRAREDMEKLFGMKIFLQLHVKVQPHWREKPMFLNTLDWRTMADNKGDDT